MADTTGTSSWSDIPLDLAGRILRRLPAYVDRVRFAAVCPQWRAATRHEPLSPPLPLLLLSDERAYSLPGSEPFHFPGCTGYTYTCGNWLVFSGEEGTFLRDPFSNATMTVPPLSRIRTRLVGSNSGAAVWSQVDVGDESSVDVATLAWKEMAETLKFEKEPKLWLCSSNLIVATISFRGGTRIAVCQAGASSWWSIWPEYLCSGFVDMALHQGKVYGIDFMTMLFAIDISTDHSSGDPWISQIRGVIKCPCLDIGRFIRDEKKPRAYLVESPGVLLVVLRMWHGPLDDDLNVLDDAAGHDEFELFEADLGQSRWLKATTIGSNEILFLHARCSRSVCVPHNALPGGCIFFLLESVWDCGLCGGSCSCRVYSMTDGKTSNPLPTVSWQPGRASGTWLFPQN